MENLYGKYKECGGKLTTDSRTIKGGEMFFALKGENFDGNEYALKALEAGAKYAVVCEGSAAANSGAEGVLVVKDTLESLKALANHHRNNTLVDGKRLTVIALTGTNGKTTTKELIKAVLSTGFKVTATEGNLNNEIGVPLSLLKIDSSTQIAVIEMGASHPGDIKSLVDVAEPDYGLITNVGKAHLAGFGSLDGVKATKGELYDFIKLHGGKIFLNVDDRNLLEMAAARSLPFIPYGLRENSAALLPLSADSPFLALSMGENEIHTQLVGAYNAANVLAAIAVGQYFGIARSRCIEAVENYVPSNKRSQMLRTAQNTLILDAYNANPSSMNVALDNFFMLRAPHKIALLGDMRELGEDSQVEHRAIVRRIVGEKLESCLVGDEFRAAVCAEGASIPCFASSSDLSEHLKRNPISSALILIKGSHSIQMETLVEAL